MLVLAAAPLAVRHAGPDFSTFLDHAIGTWRGAVFRHSPAGSGPLRATQSVHHVSEVMRACGGAVQGVSECGGLGEDDLYLNRAAGGATFFSFGSWALVSGGCDGGCVHLCLCHDESRHRIDIRLEEGELHSVSVAVEGRRATPPLATQLLSGQEAVASAESLGGVREA